MKRIIIICEGETEREFCQSVLYPHFLSKNCLIEAPLIKKSGGGIVKWTFLKKDIESILMNDRTAVLTTFIDFYGLTDKHEFPQWSDSIRFVDKVERMQFLEEAMRNNLDDDLRYRFLPYIQLHEFEGLLFNNIDVYRSQFTSTEIRDWQELTHTIESFPNSELINDGRETAPSKRLKRLIVGYNKPIYGCILAETIGLERIRNKNPRFNRWIDTLESFGA
jgi:Domain of unknown function (DUF4276)